MLVKLRLNLEIIYKENIKNPSFFKNVGIKKEYFRKLFAENGNPGSKTIEHVAEVAGVSLAWLFGEMDERTIEEHVLKIAGRKASGEVSALNQLVATLEARIRDKEQMIERDAETIKALQDTIRAQAQMMAAQSSNPAVPSIGPSATQAQKNIATPQK